MAILECTYDVFSSRGNVKYPRNNNAAYTYYNRKNQTSSILAGSVLSRTYGYDASGNVSSIIDSLTPPGSEIFEDAGVYTYQQGTNKLTQVQGEMNVIYGYDANGNIISANNRTFVYDLSNRLIRVEDNGITLGEYVYNANNQRIKKIVQGATRIFHYDLAGHLIAETTTSGQTLVEYFYLGDQPLAMIKPGESVYYYHNDHLGTPQVLTDDSQAIAWKAVYTPFGEAVASIETVENPFRFPGQYYDQETRLHYNWNRYYDPKTGRYMTPDPIGLEGGINLFVYVQNNPIIYIDLFGLLCRQKTPWEEVTCIQQPKFLYSYSKSVWTKIAEWNAVPIPGPRTGKVAKIGCCCLWEFMGYRKVNVYERIKLLEATFECCDEATGRSYLDKKYRELSTKYEEIENLEREIIFEQRRSVTCGVYTGSGACSCNEPSF